MTKSRGIKAAEELMRKLVQVPKGEVGNQPAPKQKKKGK